MRSPQVSGGGANFLCQATGRVGLLLLLLCLLFKAMFILKLAEIRQNQILDIGGGQCFAARRLLPSL